MEQKKTLQTKQTNEQLRFDRKCYAQILLGDLAALCQCEELTRLRLKCIGQTYPDRIRLDEDNPALAREAHKNGKARVGHLDNRDPQQNHESQWKGAAGPTPQLSLRYQ